MKKTKYLIILIEVLIIGFAIFYFLSKNNNVFITEYKEQNTKNNYIENIANKKNIHLKITKWYTRNNIPVYFVNAPELPIIDINISFLAGSAHFPEKPGVAALTNQMLFEGTKQYTTEEISEAFDSVGALYNSDINKDSAGVSLRSLIEADKFNKALEVFNDVLANASFPPKNLSRVKNNTIQSLKLSEQYPDHVLTKTFYKTIYKDHPYSIPTTGEIDDIKSIEVKDLINFYNDYYVTENAIISIVGQLDETKAKKLSEQISINIKAGNKSQAIPKPVVLTHNERKHIEFPTSQTHIILGTTAIKRDDPDYFALSVGNHILGGSSLSSILFDQVRKKNGLAYSVHSAFIPMKSIGPFLIEMQTRNEKAAEALTISKETLDDFLKYGPTDDELDMAKQNLIGSFPLSIASNNKKLSIIASIAFYDLPLDYMETYIDNINKITKEDIVTAFNKHIKSNNLAIITVGQEPKDNQAT